jgi:hypothetical protein
MVLNKELAVTGLLNAMAEAAVRLNEGGDGVECRLKGARITPQDVMEYSDLLRFADCGPVVKNFDIESVKNLLECKPSLFERQQDDAYALCLSNYHQDALPEPSADEFGKGFRKLLFEELAPEINYPRSFLKYMRLFD